MTDFYNIALTLSFFGKIVKLICDFDLKLNNANLLLCYAYVPTFDDETVRSGGFLCLKIGNIEQRETKVNNSEQSYTIRGNKVHHDTRQKAVVSLN